MKSLAINSVESLITFPVKIHADSQAVKNPAQIYSAEGLGWAGFFGGPLAITYLIYRDLTAMGRRDLFAQAVAWFIPFIVFWLYCLFSFPPDLVSQWILYLPQTILWWIVARHLFAEIHGQHRASGGTFNAKWYAVRFGFFVFLGLKLTFIVVGS
jgi:hypothetical protein